MASQNQQGFNNVKIYSIDLTTTDDCNFNCSYCFEHGYFNKNYFDKVDLFIQRMNELMDSFFFKSNYQLLGIGFWGGEPTLNESAIKRLIKYYGNDDRVKFFIYSNGSNIDPYMEVLEKYKTKTLFGHPKLCIQMSYDGMPVQDICRKDKAGKLTSSMVRSNIERLYKSRIPTVIKSTITPDAVKYLPAARRDILDLVNSGENNFFRSTNFFPTIDYYHVEEISDVLMEQYLIELKKSLIEIAKEEIDYAKNNNGRFFFAWFNPGRALCCAGRDMVCINWDGNIFKCHGSVYEDGKGEHFLTSLDDDNFIEALIESNKTHNTNFGVEPEECRNCEATYCLRCNSVKYNYSKKDTYIEKWRDYSDQPNLCKFYKLNGKIVHAINELLK
jgi:radical SAM protein with 4Fe4S-binding SPASM domain